MERDDDQATSHHSSQIQTETPARGEVGESRSDGHEREESAESFAAVLREKLISLRTMQPALRLITGVALAQLLATALLLVFHSLNLPLMPVGFSDSHITQMPVPVFVVSFVFFILAWSFVLTGALHSHWLVRLLGLGLFSWLLVGPVLPGNLVRWRAGLLVLLWAFGLALWLVEWRQHSLAATVPGETSAEPVEGANGRSDAEAELPQVVRRSGAFTRAAGTLADWLVALGGWRRTGRGWPLPIRTFLFVLGWLLVYYGGLFLALRPSATDFLFAGDLTFQLEALTFFLTPVLFLAGSDFAEFGELLAGRGAYLVRRLRWPWALALVTALAAAVILWRSLPVSMAPGDWAKAALAPLALGAGVAGGIVLLVRRAGVGGWPRLRLPVWGLVAGTCIYLAASWIGILYVAAHTPPPEVGLGDFRIFQHTSTQPPFSIAYPATWSTKVEVDAGPAGATFVLLNGNSAYPSGLFTIYSFPQAGATTADAQQTYQALLKAITPKGYRTVQVSSGHDGAWTSNSVTLLPGTPGQNQLDATGWYQVIGNRIWCLMGVGSHALASLESHLFPAMVESWRGDLNATAPVDSAPTFSYDPTILAAVVYGLGITLLALAVGVPLLLRSRRRPSAAGVAGLFVVLFGLLTFAQFLPNIAQLLGVPGRNVWFLSLPVPSIQLDIALGTLALLGYLAVRRRLNASTVELVAALLVLNLGLQFLASMLALYDSAIAASKASATQQFGWAEALIVVLALGWDLAMSGEQITNRDGRRFPRQVRLLLYLGYIMFVSTAVVYFSSQTFAHFSGSYESFFESEPWPQLGLQVLGVPLLLTGFILEVSRWWRERGEAEEPAAAEGESAAHETDAVAAPVVVE